MLHIRRHRRVEAVVFFGRGMDEAEVPRVEGLAFEIGDGDADGFFGGLVGTRIGALLAVKRVAEQRAADMGEMYADLVGAACLELAIQLADFGRANAGMLRAAIAFNVAVVGDGMAANIGRFDIVECPAHDRLFFAVIGRAGEAGGNPARPRLRCAAHEAGVDAVNGMFRKLLGEALMRAVRLGDDHHARRVFIEAVHDTGPHDPANARQAIGAVIEQGIDEGCTARARGGMDGHPRGFVEDNKMIILEQDIERDVFGLGRIVHGRRNANGIFDLCADLGRDLGDDIAVRADITCLDEVSNAGAR